jgi:hypothetical protein
MSFNRGCCASLPRDNRVLLSGRARHASKPSGSLLIQPGDAGMDSGLAPGTLSTRSQLNLINLYFAALAAGTGGCCNQAGDRCGEQQSVAVILVSSSVTA